MRGNYLFAPVDAALGDTMLAPALAGHRIRVVSCVLVNHAVETNLQFESTTSTLLTGPMALAVGSIFILPFNPVGWVQTHVGEFLNLSTNGEVGGCLVYEYIPDEV